MGRDGLSQMAGGTNTGCEDGGWGKEGMGKSWSGFLDRDKLGNKERWGWLGIQEARRALDGRVQVTLQGLSL